MSTLKVNTVKAQSGSNPPVFQDSSGNTVGFLPRASAILSILFSTLGSLLGKSIKYKLSL